MSGGERAELTPLMVEYLGRARPLRRPTRATAEIPLTPQQRMCLELTADGLTCEQVAKKLGITYGTVQGHLGAARQRLGAINTVHAVALAVRAGYLL